MGILTFVLQIVSALVNFILPKSIGNLLFESYWVWLVYGAEVIIWFTGYLTSNETFVDVSQKWLGATVAVHFVVVQLNSVVGKVSRRKYAPLIFYFIETIVVVIGRILKYSKLEAFGWITLITTVIIYAMFYLAGRWDKLLWIRKLITFVIVVFLLISLVCIFYLGLVYLGILPLVLDGPLGHFFANLLGLFNALPKSSF